MGMLAHVKHHCHASFPNVCQSVAKNIQRGYKVAAYCSKSKEPINKIFWSLDMAQVPPFI